MIRKLRIALANWIMPKPQFTLRSGTRFIREAYNGPYTVLRVVDGKVVEQRHEADHLMDLGQFGLSRFKPFGPTIGTLRHSAANYDYFSPVTRTKPNHEADHLMDRGPSGLSRFPFDGSGPVGDEI